MGGSSAAARIAKARAGAGLAMPTRGFSSGDFRMESGMNLLIALALVDVVIVVGAVLLVLVSGLRSRE
jgi:hypothetical protein